MQVVEFLRLQNSYKSLHFCSSCPYNSLHAGPYSKLTVIFSQIRYKKDFNELTKTQIKNLANGPSKLCLAYLIDKNLNEYKLYEKGELYIEEHEIEDFEIVETKRIGIDNSEEAKDFLWRFYIKNNNFISKK